LNADGGARVRPAALPGLHVDFTVDGRIRMQVRKE
jgi:hypothetical protein